jgi:hypothetical protein
MPRQVAVGLLLTAAILAGCAAPMERDLKPAASITAAPSATILPTAPVPPTLAAPTVTATAAISPIASATATARQPTPAPMPSLPTQPPPSSPPSPTALPGPSNTPTSRASPTSVAPTPSPPSPTPRPGPSPTVPVIDIIVDNRDPGFSSTGHWFIGDGGKSYRGDCAWAPRGIGNIAYVRPELPLGGSYEVFAWWCGDPNSDQSDRAEIQIYLTQGRVATFPVYVNLQEDAGRWNSLGTYRLERNGFLSVDSGLSGNVVADAFRFVSRSPEGSLITPTPRPTAFPWSNHPPSPLEQLTAGDLSARLGLTRRFYTASPLIASEEVAFDDCQAFPRDGCGGARDGWRAQARYQQMTVPYRVSKDYRHVAIEPSAGLAESQSLYLAGSKGNRTLRLDRYPDDTWMLSGAPLDAVAPASSMPLEPQVVKDLREFIDRYGTIRFTTNEGIQATLYGLGPRVELSEADRARLSTMIEALGQMAWTVMP